MKILHISCSPRGHAAESYRLARRIIGFVLRSEPAATLVHRELGGAAHLHVDEHYAVALGGAQQSVADLFQGGTTRQSEELIRELESADIVVIGTPMHNLTVPATLKAWIDHVVRIRRTFDIGAAGKIALLRDRPVYVAVAAGGKFSGERAGQPDFLTPYLKTVLGGIGLVDLRFFSVEGTAFGPQAVAEARMRTDAVLESYFALPRPAAPRAQQAATARS